MPDGTLQPRSEPGSLITDAAAAAAQAVSIATRGVVEAHDGSTVTVAADSICCHGDTPGAVPIAGAVRAALSDAGVTVAAFGARGG
jgi:5-oxoprolinase (ATP-hydrolysing) subunit A